MKYKNGQLVSHPTLGLGKVLNVQGDGVTVFFKDVNDRPRRKILVSRVPLEVPTNQSDPWLDSVDVAEIDGDKLKTYLTHANAIKKFLRVFPEGFHDPNYIGDGVVGGERLYKVKAHELWNETLNQTEFARLVSEGAFAEIAIRARRVESKTNLLYSMEKAALSDGLKDGAAQERFAKGLYDLIYGDDEFKSRFKRFSVVLSGLPQPKSQTLKWPIQTYYPFIALPDEHIFLKPDVTKAAAERRAFALNYKAEPNWSTYSNLLRFARTLKKDLAELEPRDMIDIQSFIWVTGNYKLD